MTSNDIDYLKRFQERSLGAEHFDHRGHLRMAWVHLRHFPPREATQRVCQGVKALAAAFGEPEKYNHTLTEAFMRLMAPRMHGEVANDFERFLAANRELVDDAEGLILRHYSRERLDSVQAKAGWIEPDLEPIDPLGNP